MGISFSNAMVCILLGFSTTTAERKSTGLYFISGRFIGLVILGLIIAAIGVIFEGYIFYLLVLFGILTIMFGALIIFKMYYRYKKHNVGNNSKDLVCGGKNKLHLPKSDSKLTKRYGFFLGIFRGATPCLKVFILAPLLIVVNLELAFLMILVFAAASTIYPLIGFLSANIIINFSKYDIYVQVAGAVILIFLGIFMIFNHITTHGIALGM